MAEDAPPPLHLEYCGTWTTLAADHPFLIGRDADLSVDDNPYLHRSFLELRWDRYWWATNVGSRLSATLSDDQGAMQAWLAPGATFPLISRVTEVRFSAGPTSYLLTLVLDEAVATFAERATADDGSTTLGPAQLTLNQRLLVLALTEGSLRSSGTSTTVPSSKEAAERLGWTLTKFNRQLDAVCQKLSRTGVRGLHGGTDQLASGRRARLAEYALAVRLVTPQDLPLLDQVPS